MGNDSKRVTPYPILKRSLAEERPDGPAPMIATLFSLLNAGFSGREIEVL
jgi:hypothetical protein